MPETPMPTLAQVLAARLASEFGGPAGVLDPDGPRWDAWSGAGCGAEPPAAAALAWADEAGVLRRGRVALWKDPRAGAGVTWLGLPLARADRAPAVGLIGFAADSAGIAAGWGPPCPEKALRAWGRSIVEALDAEGLARGSDARDDEGRRQILARLIRRLRVSDPSERFQALAVNALRGALEVEAVAWVPVAPREPVIVAGSAAGLEDEEPWRELVGLARDEAITFGQRPPGAIGRSVGWFAVAAADRQGSSGWLVAAGAAEPAAGPLPVAELLPPVASLIGTQRTNGRIYADLKDLLFGVIRSLTAAVDAKDPYTSGHSERVARIAVRLAEELGMGAHQRGDLYLMGLLHDVGKIGIDDAVLKKTGPLTPEEYRLIQSHVEIGVHILRDLKKLQHLLPGVEHHHESYDGTGYPANLAGEAIPLEARILAVADSFDAMSSTRPYRKRLTPMKIDEIFRNGSGTQWDPAIVGALFACRADVEEIRQKGLGESLTAAVNVAMGRG